MPFDPYGSNVEGSSGPTHSAVVRTDYGEVGPAPRHCKVSPVPVKSESGEVSNLSGRFAPSDSAVAVRQAADEVGL